jgi:hypothetical protein
MFSTLLRPLEWVSPYEVPAPDDMGSEFLTDLKEIKADVEELKMGLDKLLEMKAKKSSRAQQGRVLLDSDSNEQKAKERVKVNKREAGEAKASGRKTVRRLDLQN